MWRSEKGMIAVIAAVSYTLIAALSGIVVDLGLAYIEGSRMQSAADSAAYSATSFLPLSTADSSKITQAKATIKEYALKNGILEENIDSIELENVVSEFYTAARVQLKKHIPYTFGKIVGLNSAYITKSAKLAIEAVSACSAMVPLGISATQYEQAIIANGAQNVVIKYGGGDGDTGFFGALDLDGVQGGGAKDFATWLTFGYDGILNIGDILPVESGNMSGSTTTAFNIRYNQCIHYPSQGGCNDHKADPDCPRVVYIIIYTVSDNKKIQIKGFAPFVLLGTNGNGEIIASHINVQINDGDSQDISSDNINYGLFRARLIE